MKNYILTLACTLVCLFTSIGLSAQQSAKNDLSLIGKWNYEATSAPYGYNQGVIDFVEKDGKLSAKLDIQGNVTQIESFTVKGNTYTCTLYMDGASIDVTILKEGKKLTGKAEVNGDVMPVTFSRTKE